MATTPHSGAGFDGALDLAGRWGLIRALGPDAASFLHSQLTQDVVHLPSDRARLAGYCSAKGRLLASFVIWRGAADEIVMACSADVLQATLKRLSMFVLRAKCRLIDASVETAIVGLAGPSADAWLGETAPREAWGCSERDGARIVRLPAGADSVSRCLWVAGAAAPRPALPALTPEAWDWLEVGSGVPRVTAATAEQFVPQMLNLELLDGVDFKKGCYPGQEVVARSQYRGTLKRRTLLFDSSAPLAAAMEVFHSADPGQPAGIVVLAASLPSAGHRALVSLKTAALHAGELLAGPAAARLAPLAMPYEVPAEAEA